MCSLLPYFEISKERRNCKIIRSEMANDEKRMARIRGGRDKPQHDKTIGDDVGNSEVERWERIVG